MDRLALLEALARDGSAGKDAYMASLGSAEEAQKKAIRNILAMTEPTFHPGAGDEAQWVLSNISNAQVDPALKELKDAQSGWNDQVGFEKLAYDKLMADTQGGIDDRWDELNKRSALDWARHDAQDALSRQADAYSSDLMAAQQAAEAAAAAPPVFDPYAYLGAPPAPEEDTGSMFKKIWKEGVW